MQLSALGVDKFAVEYAKSKKAADDYLLQLPISALVLRPSLVYGQSANGSFSLLRSLASLAKILPLPGRGEQLFQPIHVEDLSTAIIRLLALPGEQHEVLNAVSPDPISLKQMLTHLRTWLGLPTAKNVTIPLWLIKGIAWLGNVLPHSLVNSTAYVMVMANNITSPEETAKFHQTIGFVPRSFVSGLYRHISTSQDRLSAKLYWLKPLVRLSLAFIWLFTAACCLGFYPQSASYHMLAQAGVSPYWQPLAFYGTCAVDILIGLGLLAKFHLKKLCVVQLLLILSYTAVISWKLPHLWLEPLAPIAKNIPTLACVLTLFALE